MNEYWRELFGPSIDVCGWCGDSECDGIGCIASLDPNDVNDHPAIEQLHAWIRRGRYFEFAERTLAADENRPEPPAWGVSKAPTSDTDAVTTVVADWFAFNDEGRPVAVAAAWRYPTLGSIVVEDPDPASPWVKYRNIRYVTDSDERKRLLDIMAGQRPVPARVRHRSEAPTSDGVG